MGAVLENMKPKGAHDVVVERHHEIFRQTPHRVLAEAKSESLAVPFRHCVWESMWAKNCLTHIDGFTPYNAVFGRQPPILPPIEVDDLDLVANLASGPGGSHQSCESTARACC